VQTGIAKLEMLEDSPDTLDWFYLSPAASFGAWIPQNVTGSYRTSHEVLLKDEDGTSEISGADLALAVLDEIEEPRHQRRRFHAAH
jgi:putative NADH-flavin reductase